jgi:hypothetical protein
MLGYLPPIPPHLMGRVGLMPGKGHAATDYTRQRAYSYAYSSIQQSSATPNVDDKRERIFHSSGFSLPSRYFKRFGSGLECGLASCKELSYRWVGGEREREREREKRQEQS